MRSPRACSWSMAAGRYTSAAMRTGRLPSFLSRLASLAHAVVLPEPCRPAIRMTVGAWPLKASLESPLPMSATSSSLTIFTTCCAGVRLSMTSAPSARSLTWATNSRTTLKLTSASSSARRISRIAASMSSALSLPCPLRPCMTPCRRSVSASNMEGPRGRSRSVNGSTGGAVTPPGRAGDGGRALRPRSIALEPQEVVAAPAAHHQARRLAPLAPDDTLHGSACAHPLAGPRLVGKAATERHHLAQIGHAGPLKEPQLAERVAARREQGVAVVDDPRLHERPPRGHEARVSVALGHFRRQLHEAVSYTHLRAHE